MIGTVLLEILYMMGEGAPPILPPKALYTDGIEDALMIPFTNTRAMSLQMKNFNSDGWTLDARDGTTGPGSTFIYFGDAYTLSCYINNVLTPTGITTSGVWKTIYVEFPAAFTALVTLGAIDKGQGQFKEQYHADVRLYSAPLTSGERDDLINNNSLLAPTIQHRYLFRDSLADEMGGLPAKVMDEDTPKFVAI